MCRRGHNPSCIACRVIENAPLMIAWLAMMVAMVASATSGTCSAAGHSTKNGLAPAATSPSTTTAVCPA